MYCICINVHVLVCLCPCPFVTLSICVPVRLRPCPCPSVSSSVCVSVPLPLQGLSPCPCPSVSPSVWLPVPVRFCPLCPVRLSASVRLCLYPFVSLSLLFFVLVLVTLCLCSCYCLLWLRISFNAYLLPDKPMDNFKVTFVADRQLPAFITPGWPATDNFQCLGWPIQRTKSTKLLFESTLPSSAKICEVMHQGILTIFFYWL